MKFGIMYSTYPKGKAFCHMIIIQAVLLLALCRWGVLYPMETLVQKVSDILTCLASTN